MKRYPEYKDSGIEWLGELPKHWNLKRLKFSAQHIVSNVDKKINENEIKVRLCNYTDVYNNDVIEENFPFMEGSVSTNELEKFKLREGDVIITKDSEDPKDIAIPSYVPQNYDDIVCGYHLSVIRRNGKFIGKYIYYVFQSYRFNQQFTVAARGITRFGLSHSSISNATLPIPPFEEQTTIANFLDHKTQQIDDLIERKKRLIELLKEERTAMINQAVTKGLDPNVPMKDSGIEWLGEIPEHWEVKKIKHIAFLKSGDGIKSEQIKDSGNYKVYGGNGVRGYFSNYTHEGEYILIGRQGALCGNIHIATGMFWASEHAVVVDVFNTFNLLWAKGLLESMNLNQYSVSAAQPGLSVDRVKNLQIPVPPKKEQIAIGNFINYTEDSNLEAIKTIEKETVLLQEYKTSLINEAVTGKIDVRDYHLSHAKD